MMDYEAKLYWLHDNELNFAITLHGFTAKGWLLKAQLIHRSRPANWKQSPDAKILNIELNGWGATADEALNELFASMQGKFIVTQAGLVHCDWAKS